MIIDASVAFKWIVIEADSDVAKSWIGQTELSAPFLVHSEVGNALSKRIRGGQMLPGFDLDLSLRDLDTLLSSLDETPFMPRALEIAIILNHSFYDCVYLAMAEGLNDQLLTADHTLFRKCENSQWAGIVRLLQPYDG
jgi:predicted nucleic acid-binding protein